MESYPADGARLGDAAPALEGDGIASRLLLEDLIVYNALESALIESRAFLAKEDARSRPSAPRGLSGRGSTASASLSLSRRPAFETPGPSTAITDSPGSSAVPPASARPDTRAPRPRAPRDALSPIAHAEDDVLESRLLNALDRLQRVCGGLEDVARHRSPVRDMPRRDGEVPGGERVEDGVERSRGSAGQVNDLGAHCHAPEPVKATYGVSVPAGAVDSWAAAAGPSFTERIDSVYRSIQAPKLRRLEEELRATRADLRAVARPAPARVPEEAGDVEAAIARIADLLRGSRESRARQAQDRLLRTLGTSYGRPVFVTDAVPAPWEAADHPDRVPRHPFYHHLPAPVTGGFADRAWLRDRQGDGASASSHSSQSMDVPAVPSRTLLASTPSARPTDHGPSHDEDQAFHGVTWPQHATHPADLHGLAVPSTPRVDEHSSQAEQKSFHGARPTRPTASLPDAASPPRVGRVRTASAVRSAPASPAPTVLQGALRLRGGAPSATAFSGRQWASYLGSSSRSLGWASPSVPGTSAAHMRAGTSSLSTHTVSALPPRVPPAGMAASSSGVRKAPAALPVAPPSPVRPARRPEVAGHVTFQLQGSSESRGLDTAAGLTHGSSHVAHPKNAIRVPAKRPLDVAPPKGSFVASALHDSRDASFSFPGRPRHAASSSAAQLRTAVGSTLQSWEERIRRLESDPDDLSDSDREQGRA